MFFSGPLDGGARHFPPHSAEVEAIEHGTTEIMHKVFLGPDQIEEIVDVESSSKARDICIKIGKKLGMKSIEGFALFVRILDKGNQFYSTFARVTKAYLCYSMCIMCIQRI